MTDLEKLELLELAAKVAGMEVQWDGYCFTWLRPDGESEEWNPLEYDGDAFRLAVKLALNLDIDESYQAVPFGTFR